MQNPRRDSRKDQNLQGIKSSFTKGIVITLWDLTKKYEVALKKQELFTVKESELDREEISEAYRFLGTPWERLLDGRFYQTLAIMQHRRDNAFALPDLSSEEWIRNFATEVKRRATPLLYLVSREVSTPTFSLPKEDAPITSKAVPSKSDLARLARYHISFRQLPIKELNSQRADLVKRLRGKRFCLSRLSKLLTNWELDLLSQMVRDGHLPAVILDPQTILFRSSKRNATERSYVAAAIEVEKREELHSS